MVLKIGAILGLIVAGLFLAPGASAPEAAAVSRPGAEAFLSAMIAVLFAYGGWATATFVSGEIKDSARTLPRALILGTAGVVTLYLGVNAACLHALGPGGATAIAAAIALQGIFAIATALSGTYEEILSWVVSVDFAFLALTAATLFVFRRRGGATGALVRVPWHPWTTIFFMAVSLAVVGATFVEQPARSLLGWTLVAAGRPVYLLWKRGNA